jgi:hypothetical protein
LVQNLISVKNRFLEFYQRNELLVSLAVFLFGFIFDVMTLGRIDDLLNLIQQSIYLFILGTLLIYEIKINQGTSTLSPKASRFWQYHDLIVHFLFGSLLSAYTIFYYTSASALTSFIFILLLAGLMLANEIPRFQQLGTPVRIILFTICLLSYFSFFYPILMGHVGRIPFWLGFISSLIVLVVIWKVNFQTENNDYIKRKILIPSLAVHLFFLTGYYLSLIPPVPVAVKKIGIYYDVIKLDGEYQGKHLRPYWKIWGQGSQQFLARTGDKVNVLLSIFSPARFNDKIFLKWYSQHPKKGWTLEDSISLTILGGRDDGFRGFGTKRNFHPGKWRVLVETTDGREVGRISFIIVQDQSEDLREFQTDVF